MSLYSSQENYYRFHSRIYDLTRWAFLFGRNELQDLLPSLDKNSNILEVGCGTGVHLAALQKKYPGAEITGIDPSSSMLKVAKQKITPEKTQLIQSFYKESSFPENHFDLIICSYSLTMIPDLDSVFKAIKKHLKRGGHILVVDFDQTPISFFHSWMKTNFVDFNQDLFQKLRMNFEENLFKTRKAYLGLWSFSLFAGTNRN